ncbi:MAG TPA: hypothetical protein VK932_30310 [Kofleriaceae bacterium]|nr:hypothetical protein [Kofleriaceae bacterium]
MRAPLRGVAVAAAILGAIVAIGIAACARTPPRTNETRIQKLNEITTLWAQIRGWRREAHMELDPAPLTMHQWRGRTVPEAARVCPESLRVPPRCDDVCSIGDAICDNAERICTLADELGNDHLAQEKCTSAKASCREAKQRCCSCAAAVPAEVTP